MQSGTTQLPGNPINDPVPNPYPEPTRPLRAGDTGAGVRWVQFSLAIAGYLPDDAVNGVFDAATESAVTALQDDLGLTLSGIVGREMRAVLYAALGNAPRPADAGLLNKIPDLSSYQGDIDWTLAATEILFAIVRVQFGTTRDVLFRRNATFLSAYRIPFGVYCYMNARTPDAAREEARLFHARAAFVAPKFYVCDVEHEPESPRETVSAFLSELRRLGAEKIGLYIAHHRYQLYNVNTDEADFLWLPRYGTNDGSYQINPAFPCDLHQYTSAGRLPGIDGDTDLNRLTARLPLRFFINPE